MFEEDEVLASEQEKAQILFEQVQTLVEANRLQRLSRTSIRKASKPRHRRA